MTKVAFIAALLAGAVVTAQVKLTLPLNEADGVTVMVLVFPVVAPAAKVRLPGLDASEKLAGVTLTMIERFSVMLPAFAVTLMV